MQFRHIAIEGPIGAGKTALAERLGTRLDASVVLEQTDNPFLADFYADRPGASLQAQLFYLLNRHRQQTSLRQTDLFTQTTICDYVFDKDKIFAYLNLDDNELFIYQRLYDLLARDVPSPDLVVYLQAPTDVLLRRVHSRRLDRSVRWVMERSTTYQELDRAQGKGQRAHCASLCALPSACPRPSALCLPYALCPMPSALCPDKLLDRCRGSRRPASRWPRRPGKRRAGSPRASGSSVPTAPRSSTTRI
ncbi:MAG: hypothetical protein DMG04_27275 [Acidobacteria bacterium]|nr:MAG: hypothetical protein DMG04_27275 [Acidobacteriota bacterium]